LVLQTQAGPTSASVMTYIMSGGALNSTHSLKPYNRINLASKRTHSRRTREIKTKTKTLKQPGNV